MSEKWQSVAGHICLSLSRNRHQGKLANRHQASTLCTRHLASAHVQTQPCHSLHEILHSRALPALKELLVVGVQHKPDFIIAVQFNAAVQLRDNEPLAVAIRQPEFGAPALKPVVVGGDAFRQPLLVLETAFPR